MTKHEADVIGGLNLTDQISNEAYKQIMIAAQEENEVGDVLDKIRAEFQKELNICDDSECDMVWAVAMEFALEVIDKYREGSDKK